MRLHPSTVAVVILVVIQAAMFASGSPTIYSSGHGSRQKRWNPSRAQARMDAAISSLRTEFDQNLHDMEVRLSRALSVCDVYYNKVCYWTEIHANKDIDFAEARSICRFRDSHVADVVDRTHYNLLVEKLRTQLPAEESFVSFWLGLGQNPGTGDVILTTGLYANYLQWYPIDEPDRDSSDTNIVLKVRRSSTSSYQGMYDRSPTTSYRGVVCQYNIP